MKSLILTVADRKATREGEMSENALAAGEINQNFKSGSFKDLYQRNVSVVVSLDIQLRIVGIIYRTKRDVMGIEAVSFLGEHQVTLKHYLFLNMHYLLK